MIYEIMGIAAFAAFGLYDVNSVIWKNRIADRLFFAGSAAITVSCVLAVYDAVSAEKSLLDIPQVIKTAALIAGAISVVLLVYTLFFAIPFRDTYVDRDGTGKRTVWTNRNVCALQASGRSVVHHHGDMHVYRIYDE